MSVGWVLLFELEIRLVESDWGSDGDEDGDVNGEDSGVLEDGEVSDESDWLDEEFVVRVEYTILLFLFVDIDCFSLLRFLFELVFRYLILFTKL